MVTLRRNDRNSKIVVTAAGIRRALVVLFLTLVVFLIWAGGSTSKGGGGGGAAIRGGEVRGEVIVSPAALTAPAPDADADADADADIDTAGGDTPYYDSTFSSVSRTGKLGCDPPPLGPPGPPFYSQTAAKAVLKKFVERRTSEKGMARFVPCLNEMMHEAIATSKTLVTVQLGGMDGETGDPMHKFAAWHEDISRWMPVVVEPVPENYEKLVETYRSHMNRPIDGKSATCAHVLHQMVNYDASTQNPAGSGMCPFCHFDHDKEECANQPEWMKYETGSMECGSEMKQKCFLKSSFVCTGVRDALEAVNLHPRDVAALQIDVEGFEQMILEGYFAEIQESEYPPIINFESKILKGRKTYNDVDAFLRKKGYGLHQKRVDTLAILGVQGLTKPP